VIAAFYSQEQTYITNVLKGSANIVRTVILELDVWIKLLWSHKRQRWDDNVKWIVEKKVLMEGEHVYLQLSFKFLLFSVNVTSNPRQ
jgi:hypothetical protein